MTKKEKVQHAKLIKMINEEREKVAGYNELAKIHTAYISILLKRLNATNEESAITIGQDEIKEAMEKFEARALYSAESKSQSLYCSEL